MKQIERGAVIIFPTRRADCFWCWLPPCSIDGARSLSVHLICQWNSPEFRPPRNLLPFRISFTCLLLVGSLDSSFECSSRTTHRWRGRGLPSFEIPVPLLWFIRIWMHRYETWVPNSFRFDGEADGRWTRRINGYTSITHGFTVLLVRSILRVLIGCANFFVPLIWSICWLNYN